MRKKIHNGEKRAGFAKRQMLSRGIFVLLFVAVFAVVFIINGLRTTPILMYHSVCGISESSMDVSYENFVKQIEYLNKAGYRAISLDELINEIKQGHRFLPKTVVITFDDGFEDNFTKAFPALAKYGMTATIFLITNDIGKKNGYLNWEQVEVMARNGIDFGGHTRNHVYLPSVKEENVLIDEIAGCKKDIEGHIGRAVDFFCYPLGAFDERVKNAVSASGYRGAVTTHRSINKRNKDLYALNRIKVSDSDMNKPFHFEVKLSGFYNVFRKAH
ncbi:MAG TPA: polysaccharide deacetylase family protein [Candidatus Omnitrophota bacterium]|nr:polysaccharide deacetylase family protein [Candidatus Omnitrophota bacterium]HPS20810.1 polysaccharide deacetylase family protein [Candidatus Omnitrophota bacterium]